MKREYQVTLRKRNGTKFVCGMLATDAEEAIAKAYDIAPNDSDYYAGEWIVTEIRIKSDEKLT